MANATFEDHPTDPDKVILRKKPYLDKGRDYEEGFVDGMQHQMQSSVDKAVNRMAQPEQEPVKIAHRHEWFRTGEMKVGQMRCISCGAWSQEEITQRTWVGLTDDEYFGLQMKIKTPMISVQDYIDAMRMVEAKLKDKNGYAEEKNT